MPVPELFLDSYLFLYTFLPSTLFLFLSKQLHIFQAQGFIRKADSCWSRQETAS